MFFIVWGLRIACFVNACNFMLCLFVLVCGFVGFVCC